MATIYVDSAVDDALRRERLYQGDLFVYSATESSVALCGLARELSEEAFAPHDPRPHRSSMPAEDYVEILADLKPRFIHHPRCKELIGGCSPSSAATSRRRTSTCRASARWRTAST